MSTHWDVIIVGAGPAGSTLGRALSERGLRVLILDKEIFPRYKACGGGLNVRAANMLDVDLSSVVEDTIYGARIAFRRGDPSTNWSDRPLTYMVSRESFDYLLLQHAIASGCAVREGEKVRGVRVRESDVAVCSDGGTYSGKVVVGADGAHGVVASSVGLMEDAFVAIAIESEVEVSASDLEDWRNVVLLDLGSIRGGYGWVFPKAHHLSIGAGGPLTRAKELRVYYQAFTAGWRSAMKQYHVLRKRGHRLPVRRKGAAIQCHRVLLVGDAAGLIDPFDGEGIYYAIRSAQLAAEVLADYLEHPQQVDLAQYQALVDRELMAEIQRAKALMRVFNLCPRFFIAALERGGLLWRTACEFLRGEKTYVDIGRALGPLEFILATIDW